MSAYDELMTSCGPTIYSREFTVWVCQQIDALRADIVDMLEKTAALRSENAALRAALTPPAAPESPLQRAFEVRTPCPYEHETAAEFFIMRNERDRG